MQNTVVSILLCTSLAVAAACSDSASDSSSTTRATAATTGPSGSGGGSSTSAAGGQTTSSGTVPTTSGSGGTGSGAGGTSGSGGSGAPTDASAPDTSVGRDASSVSDAPMIGDASRPVKPSAGCGKTNPPMGARTVMTGGQPGAFNVRLPTGYDATTPMPLGFGFHGANNPACGPTGGECQGFAMLPAVTVYMKSFGTNWESATLQQNLTFFDDTLALMKNEYCIDENHIFIAGVSSGGQFIEYLTCRFGDWMWQTTAVSASVVNAANMNCKGTPPVLVIHGVTDMAGNYGQGVAEMFARRNGCSTTPPAALAQTYTDLRAAFNAVPRREEQKCLDWDGCTAAPVRICLHSQMTYGGLTHGWPRVGGQLIGEFQAGVK